MWHHLFLTIRSCFSHIRHMIGKGAVVQGEKNVRLREEKIDFGLCVCLCKYGKKILKYKKILI